MRMWVVLVRKCCTDAMLFSGHVDCEVLFEDAYFCVCP